MKGMMTTLFLGVISAYFSGIFLSKNKWVGFCGAFLFAMGSYAYYFILAKIWTTINFLPDWPFEIGILTFILATDAGIAFTEGRKRLGIVLALLTTLSVLAVPLLYNYFGR